MRATIFVSSLSMSGNGRGSKIRTCDPLLPKQVRYQTALCPDRPLRLQHIHSSPRCSKLGLWFRRPVEAGIDDLVASLEADAGGGAGIQLEHALHIAFGGDDLGGEGLGAAFDAMHFAVGADEDHVERDEGI